LTFQHFEELRDVLLQNDTGAMFSHSAIDLLLSVRAELSLSLRRLHYFSYTNSSCCV